MLLVLIIFVVTLSVLRASLDGGLWIEWSALGVALLAFPFSKRWSRVSLLNPVYLSAFYLLMAYPVRAVVVRLNIDGVREDFPGLLTNDELLTQAMFVTVLGFAFYLIGYYNVSRGLVRAFTKIGQRFSSGSNSSWMRKMVLIFLIGWGSVAFQHIIGTWSNFAGMGTDWDPNTNQLFAYLFKYVWFAFIGIAVYLWAKDSDKSPIGLAVGITLVCLTFILSMLLLGSKTWLAYPLLWLLLAAYANDRQVSKLTVIGFMGVAVLVIFVYVNAYRDLYRTQYGFRSDIGAESIGLVKNVFDDGFGEDDSPMLALLFNRFGGLDSLAKIMVVFPDRIGYRYFDQLAVMPFTLIPRAIFPYKPTSDTGKLFTEHVYGMTGGGSASPHIIGEGYLNFGLVGVAFVCWLWGTVQSLVYQGFYLPNKGSRLVTMLYLFFMLETIGFGGWYLGWMAGFPGQFVVLLPLIVLVRANIGSGRGNALFQVSTRGR